MKHIQISYFFGGHTPETRHRHFIRSSVRSRPSERRDSGCEERVDLETASHFVEWTQIPNEKELLDILQTSKSPDSDQHTWILTDNLISSSFRRTLTIPHTLRSLDATIPAAISSNRILRTICPGIHWLSEKILVSEADERDVAATEVVR